MRTAYAPCYQRRHGHAQAAEEHGVGKLQISEDVLVEQDERGPKEHVQGANEYCFGVIHQVDLCALGVGADGVKHSPAPVLSLGLVFVPVPAPDSTFWKGVVRPSGRGILVSFPEVSTWEGEGTRHRAGWGR